MYKSLVQTLLAASFALFCAFQSLGGGGMNIGARTAAWAGGESWRRIIFTEGKYISSNGDVTDSTNSFMSEYISVDGGKSVTFRGPNWAPGQLPSNYGYIAEYDDELNFLIAHRYFRQVSASGVNPIVFTTKASTRFIRFCCGRSDMFSDVYDVWLRYDEANYVITNWKIKD